MKFNYTPEIWDDGRIPKISKRGSVTIVYCHSCDFGAQLPGGTTAGLQVRMIHDESHGANEPSHIIATRQTAFGLGLAFVTFHTFDAERFVLREEDRVHPTRHQIPCVSCKLVWFFDLPAGTEFEDFVLIHSYSDGSHYVIQRRDNGDEILFAKVVRDPSCESCGAPATVEMLDGSTWCLACDGSAERLGYNKIESR